jgi:hypothetical protein
MQVSPQGPGFQVPISMRWIPSSGSRMPGFRLRNLSIPPRARPARPEGLAEGLLAMGGELGDGSRRAHPLDRL